MKTLYIIAAVILLASCKKDEPATTGTSQRVYMRMESVSPNGETIYSPITVVTLK